MGTESVNESFVFVDEGLVYFAEDSELGGFIPLHMDDNNKGLDAKTHVVSIRNEMQERMRSILHAAIQTARSNVGKK